MGSATAGSGPTLRVEDTRLDLSKERADLVSRALTLIEWSSEQSREIRACRYRDHIYRVAAERRSFLVTNSSSS